MSTSTSIASRRVRRITTLAVLLAPFLVARLCAAQTTTSTGETAGDYVDQRDASGQRVVFKDDPLGADGNAATGATIRVRPRAARVGLLRPRVQFIPELLKSVENL